MTATAILDRMVKLGIVGEAEARARLGKIAREIRASAIGKTGSLPYSTLEFMQYIDRVANYGKDDVTDGDILRIFEVLREDRHYLRGKRQELSMAVQKKLMHVMESRADRQKIAINLDLALWDLDQIDPPLQQEKDKNPSGTSLNPSRERE